MTFNEYTNYFLHKRKIDTIPKQCIVGYCYKYTRAATYDLFCGPCHGHILHKTCLKLQSKNTVLVFFTITTIIVIIIINCCCKSNICLHMSYNNLCKDNFPLSLRLLLIILLLLLNICGESNFHYQQLLFFSIIKIAQKSYIYCGFIQQFM